MPSLLGCPAPPAAPCSSLHSLQPEDPRAPHITTTLHESISLYSYFSHGKVLFLLSSPFLAAPFFHASSHPPLCLLHHYCSYSCFYHPSLRASLFSPLLSFSSLPSIRALPTLGFLLLSLGLHPPHFCISLLG